MGAELAAGCSRHFPTTITDGPNSAANRGEQAGACFQGSPSLSYLPCCGARWAGVATFGILCGRRLLLLKTQLLSRKLGGVKGSLFTGLRPEQRLEKGLRRNKGELKPPPERDREKLGLLEMGRSRREGGRADGMEEGREGPMVRVWDDKPGEYPGGEEAGGLIAL